MVIDTSALVAIMYNESTAPRLVAAIDESTVRLISAGTVLEASLVLLDARLRSIKAEIVPIDGEQLLFVGDDFAYTDVTAVVW